MGVLKIIEAAVWLDIAIQITVPQYGCVDVGSSPNGLADNIDIEGSIGAGFDGLPVVIVIDVIDCTGRNAAATWWIGFRDAILHGVIGNFS